MPKPPIPIWLREYTMNFTDIQVNLTATLPMEKGYLGTLTAVASYSCYEAAPVSYEIWAIEYGVEGFETSSFNRRIILGNRGTKDVLSGFQNDQHCMEPSCPGKGCTRNRLVTHTPGRTLWCMTHTPGRTLWCMNCWSDDMYESGMGGIGVPPFILYYSRNPEAFLRNLRGCAHCKTQFTVADAESMDEPNTSVFLPIQRKILDTAVESALQSAGIFGVVQRTRHLNVNLSHEQHYEIVAAALHPDRIERIHKQTGMDVWDILDNM